MRTAVEEGKPWPLFWTRTQGKGRVFVSVPGHYTWTFDDPLFRLLLLPLEKVQGPAASHPEGDVLYHSLQVFELARDCRAYDVEFLLAALLHEGGAGVHLVHRRPAIKFTAEPAPQLPGLV